MSEFSARRFTREALAYADQEEYMEDLIGGIQEFMAIKDDEEAKEAVRVGFEELVGLTQADTYTIALNISDNEDDARDIVQEVYAKAFNSLPKLRDRTKFPAWFYKISKNTALGYVKDRTRRRYVDLDDTPNDFILYDAGLFESTTNKQLGDRLVAALQKLKPSRRSVVVLRCIQDLPHVSPAHIPEGRSITEELGITESASKLRLKRGLEQIRMYLEEDQEEVA